MGTFHLQIAGCEEPLEGRELINCTGLRAASLAQSLSGCTAKIAPRACFARGHYFSRAGRAPHSRLVYPVAESAGLGIHVTCGPAGMILFRTEVEWL